MKNCALYSSTFDLDQIVDLMKAIDPNGKMSVNESKTRIEIVSKGWLRRKTTAFNIMTSKTHPDEFANMRSGMEQFFAQIPAENEPLQQKLLIKISTLNTVIGVETEDDISESLFTDLLSIIRPLDGLMFWGGGQLLNPEGRLLLGTDGRSEVDDYTVTAHTSFLHGEEPASATGTERKLRSEAILSAQGFQKMPPMPGRLGDEAAGRIRTLAETAQRAVALCITAVKGECIGARESPEDTRELISRITAQYGADGFFSPEEQAFIQNGQADESEAVPFSWRYEGFWVLLWALGHVDTLGDPTDICNVPEAVSKLQQFETFDAFLAGSRLRSSGELLDAADLIYRYDWICVDSRIQGQPAPGGLNAGVVYERHHALNWLTGYMGQEWDDVRTDT